MISRLALVLALGAAPVAAAVYVPEPVRLTPDNLTLAELAAEGLDPDHYAGGKAKAPVAVPPAPPSFSLPCRAHEYWRPENFRFCGYPAREPVGVAVRDVVWLWDDWGGTTTRIVHVPVPASPVPIPIGGAFWSLVAAIGALVLVRRAQA
jgi:hypothetical protein